jgi:hypothetical protein
MEELAGKPMLATSPVAEHFAELEAALGLLVPALERLHDAQVRQRGAIASGDLRPLLASMAELDDAGLRVAGLEARRRAAQDALEAHFRTSGLRELAARADEARRARLLVLLDRLADVVPGLREQGRRNAALLDSALDMTRRTRAQLEKLSGANALYDPRMARRNHAARRAATPPDAQLGGAAGAPDRGAVPASATEAP